jgi:hypothetical protein
VLIGSFTWYFPLRLYFLLAHSVEAEVITLRRSDAVMYLHEDVEGFRPADKPYFVEIRFGGIIERLVAPDRIGPHEHHHRPLQAVFLLVRCRSCTQI